MRIWYQYPGPVSPFRKDVVFAAVHAVIDRVRRPDTQVDIIPTRRGLAAFNKFGTTYSTNLANQEIIDSVTHAAEQGYDAAIIGVSSDAGLKEAKELLPIPITGITESAVHYATHWGERFALICNPSSGTTNARNRHLRNRTAQLTAYGVIDQCVDIVEMDMPQQEYLDDLANRRHDTILSTFEIQARRLIDEGADVIIAGDTILSMALAEHNMFEIPGTGAVVVDLISSAIKFTESLVDIKNAFGIVRSRAGSYTGAPPEIIAGVRETFGIPVTYQPLE